MFSLLRKYALISLLAIFAVSAHAEGDHDDDHHDNDDSSKRASCEIGGEIPKWTALFGKCIDGCKDLNLVSGVTDKLVMQVNEQNNTPQGYKVKLSSANSGKLKNSFLPSAVISYSAKYNGAPVTLSAAGSIVTSQGPQLSPINVTKDLKVSIGANPAASSMSGFYSDTLTFEITAN